MATKALPGTRRTVRPVHPVPTPAPLTTKDGETGHVQVLGRPVSLSIIHRDTGLSLSHLSRVFGGHRTPSTRVLVRLARYLEVTTDALLTELGRIQAERNRTVGESEGDEEREPGLITGSVAVG